MGQGSGTTRYDRPYPRMPCPKERFKPLLPDRPAPLTGQIIAPSCENLHFLWLPSATSNGNSMTQFQYLMEENAYIGSFKWSSFLCGRTFATFFKWRGFSRKRNIFFILTGDKQKQQKQTRLKVQKLRGLFIN